MSSAMFCCHMGHDTNDCKEPAEFVLCDRGRRFDECFFHVCKVHLSQWTGPDVEVYVMNPDGSAGDSVQYTSSVFDHISLCRGK
jgi:hypothetical protein